MNERWTTTLAILVAMVTAQTALSGGGPPEYEVTAIIEGFQCGDHLAGVAPYALNEAGDVTGVVICSLVKRAFRWTADTGLEVIPMPAGTTGSQGLAISGSKVVGTYDNPILELGRAGFLYDFETGQFTSLGTLPGGNTSEARGINSAGEIVGFWGDVVNGPYPLAFIWRDGEMIDIHPDFGTSRSVPGDINCESLMTGWMGSSPVTDARAFIWDEGKVTQLPEIPGGITSEGDAINALGDVVGRGWFFDPELNATVWRAFAFIDGEAINLGTLPGIERSLARGINDDQIVVGFAQVPPLRAFVWKDGLLSDLNDLVSPSFNGEISTARGINQNGQIAAQAHSDVLDATVGLLLSPINGGIPADLDNDGQVGASDLLILLASWGSCEDCGACAADLDGNGAVGASDLLILLSNWG